MCEGRALYVKTFLVVVVVVSCSCVTKIITGTMFEVSQSKHGIAPKKCVIDRFRCRVFT